VTTGLGPTWNNCNIKISFVKVFDRSSRIEIKAEYSA
jgi:hypothetical protein